MRISGLKNYHNLSCKNNVNDFLNIGADLLKNGNYQDWVKFEYVFPKNELDFIKRDPKLRETERTKAHLDQIQ
jgi:hypothetical protein